MSDVSRTPALTNFLPSFTKAPGFRLLYALAAALVFGLPLGFFHGPFWPVVVGGLAAAVLALWLERDALLAPPATPRKTNIAVLLSAAYVFMAIVCVGLVSVGCFLGEGLRAKF